MVMCVTVTFVARGRRVGNDGCGKDLMHSRKNKIKKRKSLL